MTVIYLNEFEQLGNIFNQIFDQEVLNNLSRLPWGNCGLNRVPPCPNRQDKAVSLKKEKNNLDESFYINLDVQQFRPEEITVKLSSENENTVTVEGKHEERPDEHGLISRQFLRKFIIPEGHDIDKIESRLSSDGVLRISAPKVKAQAELGPKDVTLNRST